MRRLLAAWGLVGCLAPGGAALAEYQGPDYVKLKALLPPGSDAALCFARTYDARHLQNHPRQKVTEIMLFLRYVTLGEDDAILNAIEGGGSEKQYFRYDFTLAASVKDRSRTLYASGDCASAEAIGCGVECDGGGVEIESVAGRPDTLRLRLERIRMTLGCGDGEAVDLEGGADDKVFLLTQAPRALCEAMTVKAGK